MSHSRRPALVALLLLSLPACHGARPPQPAPGVTAAAPAAQSLRLAELFRSGGDTLVASDRTLALAGERVRLTGFMAQMELPPRGGFFVTPQPVHCDEAGGGTADLPLESVLVLSESAKGRAIPWIKGALEMTGILEVGNRADDDGRVSAFRLRLDGPLETQVAFNHSTPAGAPSASHGERRTDAP